MMPPFCSPCNCLDHFFAFTSFSLDVMHFLMLLIARSTPSSNMSTACDMALSWSIVMPIIAAHLSKTWQDPRVTSSLLTLKKSSTQCPIGHNVCLLQHAHMNSATRWEECVLDVAPKGHAKCCDTNISPPLAKITHKNPRRLLCPMVIAGTRF